MRDERRDKTFWFDRCSISEIEILMFCFEMESGPGSPVGQPPRAKWTSPGPPQACGDLEIGGFL